MLRGSCLCAKIHYEIDGVVSEMTNCHCGMCRKAHGAAFATFLMPGPGGFRWTQGEELVERYASSKELERLFCRVCGSSLAVTEPASGGVYVAAGTLDGDPGVRAGSHIFVGSKAPWHEILDELPRSEEYPADEG